MAAYATPADMIVRFDSRELGDLVSDTGARVSEANLPADTKLLAILDDASGRIEGALLVGSRYTIDDLTSLTGNAAAYLKRITCDVAMGMLWERRPEGASDARVAAMERSESHLEDLRKGRNIFGLEPQQDAGLPKAITPTLSAVQSQGLLRDSVLHYFPARRRPLPTS